MSNSNSNGNNNSNSSSSSSNSNSTNSNNSAMQLYESLTYETHIALNCVYKWTNLTWCFINYGERKIRCVIINIIMYVSMYVCMRVSIAINHTVRHLCSLESIGLPSI